MGRERLEQRVAEEVGAVFLDGAGMAVDDREHADGLGFRSLPRPAGWTGAFDRCRQAGHRLTDAT